MAFKDEVRTVTPFRHVLESRVPRPVDVFMSEDLLRATEEPLWQEVVCVANFPGVTRVAVTPDAHASGNGIPVGLAVETNGSVIVPAAAGYDISCGMALARTDLSFEDVADDARVRAWIAAVTARVSVGVGGNSVSGPLSGKAFTEILLHGAHAVERRGAVLSSLERTHLPVDEALLDVAPKAMRGIAQIGSLGGGNHFLELQVDQDGAVWIMIHTGSRGYGHGTADAFFRRGAELFRDRGTPLKRIEQAWFRTDEPIGREYVAAMNSAANFAIVNRLAIYRAVEEATAEALGGNCELLYEISHNLVQEEAGRLVHRKGATRAFPAGHPALAGTKWSATGHPILIPGSMGTRSAVLYARPGAADSIHSVNHGCGRVMTRGDAKRRLALKLGLVDTEEEALAAVPDMQRMINDEMDRLGILTNSENVPADECLHVYKDIDQILLSVEGAGLAAVAASLRPRAVIKGLD